jgi:transcription elongation factor Elf1
MAPQATYPINCKSCGKIFEVANPRPDETPSRVMVTDDAWMTPTYEVVCTACPHCGQETSVEFKYPRHRTQRNTARQGTASRHVCRE